MRGKRLIMTVITVRLILQIGKVLTDSHAVLDIALKTVILISHTSIKAKKVISTHLMTKPLFQQKSTTTEARFLQLLDSDFDDFI